MGAPKKGDVLLGKYRVEEILGQGGMGVVVAAQHLELGDRVAIKLLLDDIRDDPENQERFLREARAARRIRSEHVTRVTDVGRLETGELYIVMEYLEGMTLGEVRRKCGPLEVEVAVDYVLQALEALAEAHLHKIIHRDLKPANLFLTTHADGTPLVKVLDFGISKMQSASAQSSEPHMTRSGLLMGSPNYMAPEQIASSRGVDARVDIWAMGVVLYNLITGKLPFGGSSPTQIFAQVLEGNPIPPSALRPTIPSELDAVVLRCLEKSPDARFFNVASLAAALGPFAPPRARVSVDRIARVLGVPVVPSSGEFQPRSSYISLPSLPPMPDEIPIAPLQSGPPPPNRNVTLFTGTGMSRTLERIKSAAQATSALAFVGAGCAAALGMIVFFSMTGRSADAESTQPTTSNEAPASTSLPVGSEKSNAAGSLPPTTPSASASPEAAPPSVAPLEQSRPDRPAPNPTTSEGVAPAFGVTPQAPTSARLKPSAVPSASSGSSPSGKVKPKPKIPISDLPRDR
jgi:serine/threonine protein kinase